MTAAPYICPCCRQPAERPAITAMVRELPFMQGALLRVLLAQGGKYASTPALVDMVWCGTDGPSAPSVSLSRLVSQLNARLDGTGWRVESRPWHGYRLVQHG